MEGRVVWCHLWTPPPHFFSLFACQIIPTPEEASQFLGIPSDHLPSMCPPEQFLWHMARVKRAKRKIEALIVLRHFDNMTSDLTAMIQTFSRAAREVRASKLLRAALSAALQVGHELNNGTARGSARGISLESLCKLADIKVTPAGQRAGREAEEGGSSSAGSSSSAVQGSSSSSSMAAQPGAAMNGTSGGQVTARALLTERAATLLDVVVVLVYEAVRQGREGEGARGTERGGQPKAETMPLMMDELAAVGEAAKLSDVSSLRHVHAVLHCTATCVQKTMSVHSRVCACPCEVHNSCSCLCLQVPPENTPISVPSGFLVMHNGNHNGIIASQATGTAASLSPITLPRACAVYALSTSSRSKHSCISPPLTLLPSRFSSLPSSLVGRLTSQRHCQP